jgi:hypothetical protein
LHKEVMQEVADGAVQRCRQALELHGLRSRVK